jgi:hypothetical protein
MFRTRNFVLFLIGGFVVIAGMVVVEVPKARSLASVSTAWTLSSDTGTQTYTAHIPPTLDDRAARLADLKAKLADRTIIAAPEVDTPPASPTKPTETATTTSVAVLQKCSGYTPVTLPWIPQRITMTEREGIRFYTEPTVDAVGDTSDEVVHARIVMRTWPMGTPSCIQSDVIGIATDGSLIRNTDVALYKVFSGTTEIGYSLDGYPMYGVTPGVETDSCGGAMVAGAYRYMVDGKRPTIITCFAGIPTSIQ